MIKFCLSLYAFLHILQIGVCIAQDVKTELYQNTIEQPPKCDNLVLHNKVLERISEYTNIQDAQSTIAKRKKTLLLKNITGFEDVDVKSFKPETDFQTANALISLKINKHLTNDDFILCKQIGNYQHPLYLVIYPHDNMYLVHILNLDPYSDNYEKITLTYP